MIPRISGATLYFGTTVSPQSKTQVTNKPVATAPKEPTPKPDSNAAKRIERLSRFAVSCIDKIKPGTKSDVVDRRVKKFRRTVGEIDRIVSCNVHAPDWNCEHSLGIARDVLKLMKTSHEKARQLLEAGLKDAHRKITTKLCGSLHITLANQRQSDIRKLNEAKGDEAQELRKLVDTMYSDFDTAYHDIGAAKHELKVYQEPAA